MTNRRELGVIILAAGKGVRMQSSQVKVLHKVGEEPMILRVVRTAKSLDPRKIVIVVGQEKDQVMDALKDEEVTFVIQEEQLGTGHAVLQAVKEFEGFQGDIVVLCGDVPLLSQMTLDKLLNKHYVSNASATVLATIFDNPVGYGRIVRNGDGTLDRIVEENDCTDELRVIKEVNAGIYVFDSQPLFRFLPHLCSENIQREYYLPDVLLLLRLEGFPVAVGHIADNREVVGVNTKAQLMEINQIYEELYGKN